MTNISKLAGQIESSYRIASKQYAEFGVSTENALNALERVAISLHCWQGDDVRGFEGGEQELGGGLAVTGSYPGRARGADELRADLQLALALIPGRHRVNLHASYAETAGVPIERDELTPEHFRNWMDWAPGFCAGLDFNSTFFAHEKAASGFTLAHTDPAIRDFWIRHGVACRRIAAAFGTAQVTPAIHNLWIPDGFKDTPVDRFGPRQRLIESLDRVFAEPLSPSVLLDAVECKLFGLGSECYVVGSHEFYLGYALSRGKLLCLDSGHFHPTEVISDKISAVLSFVDQILLHVSRGVRWDSDHVVTQSDELLAIAQELVRGRFLDRVHLGLDYFDASINRIAAWVIGSRCLLRSLLIALLEPIEELRQCEQGGDFTARLAIQEELKAMPYAAVWDYFCLRHNVPVGRRWLDRVREYERQCLAQRS